MDDFGVVGSGIGGACSALFLSKKFQTTLYEKESYLGGCSSTFKHQKNFYNTGATTFAGYEKDAYMYDFFKTHQVDFDKKLLPSALTVLIGDKKIERFQNFKAFLEEINSAFYHPKNASFYTLIVEINRQFFSLNDFYYTNASPLKKLQSLYSFKNLFMRFYPYLFINAEHFIQKYFGHLDKEYLNYLENQVLIVAQAKLKEVNFLTAALALSYQFMDNYYIFGGMGSLFEAIEKQLPHVKKNTFIEKITTTQSGFVLHSHKGEFEAKNIVLNASLFDVAPLFDDQKIKSYIASYQKLDLGTSAFMVYLTINSPKVFKHHYQIIHHEILKYTISNSLFVSFGDSYDTRMKQSVTISVHTKNALWDEHCILEQKMELEDIIKTIICEKLGLEMSEIVNSLSATPQTFKRFINRTSLGGIPMRQENLIFKLPSNDSPFKGLYHVGDTTFAAQGWLGVMMGVRNLERLICKG
ncbi:MAG: NAD(P)-binding protein [Campylobacteraceae bacterium]|nr:NAD(P)-binding protein [Campylobacteraceae bacterium]